MQDTYIKKTLIVLLALFTPVAILAAEVGLSRSANTNSGKQNYTQMPELRDPFTTSNRMYATVGNQSALLAGSGQGFVPGYGVQNVPKMRLKGYVTKGKNKSTALLEVEGAGVYMVSKGDEIGLHAIGQNTVLKIVDVGQNGVKVQSGQVNQVIVVR